MDSYNCYKATKFNENDKFNMKKTAALIKRLDL